MAHASSASNPLYGLMAEFEDVNSLTEAAKRTYAEGYRKMDAYSPFPIEPVWEAMHVHDRPVSFFVLCNVGVPQALWLGWVRRRPVALFALGLVVLVGMWLERFVIIVQSLSHDFLPSAWGIFVPTFWDFALLAGSLGAFALLFLLFLRFLPAISMAELRKEAHGEPMHP